MIERWGSYTQPDPVWKGIPGFTDFYEVYDDLAAHARDGDVMVEVGCLLGRSACYLGEKLQAAGKQVTLLCVDTWPALYRWGPEHLPDQRLELEAPFETFLANIRQSGLVNMIIPIRAPSVVAAKLVCNDLATVFIDAGHSYEDVKADIAAWLPKVRAGGVISGHDYNEPSFPGVVQAVNEAFGDRIRVQGSCWIVDV